MRRCYIVCSFRSELFNSKGVTFPCSALKYLHDLAKEVLSPLSDELGSEPAAEDGSRGRAGAGPKSLKGRQGQVQGRFTELRNA